MKSLPDDYFAHITQIPPSYLQARGIRGLALDIDNTLAHDGVCELAEDIGGWLAQIRNAGIAAVILSNNNEARAASFAALCGLPHIANAAKPSRQTVAAVLHALGTNPAETAIIGDQFFTDIAYGRRAGFWTILVDQIGGDALLFVRLKRILERPLLRKLRKRGYSKP